MFRGGIKQCATSSKSGCLFKPAASRFRGHVHMSLHDWIESKRSALCCCSSGHCIRSGLQLMINDHRTETKFQIMGH